LFVFCGSVSTIQVIHAFFVSVVISKKFHVLLSVLKLKVNFVVVDAVCCFCIIVDDRNFFFGLRFFEIVVVCYAELFYRSFLGFRVLHGGVRLN